MMTLWTIQAVGWEINMYRLVLTAAWLLGVAGVVGASSPDPRDLAVPSTETERARSLVSKLGSENFPERESAQEALVRMGRLALPALVDALGTHPSPEVRFRCQALVPKASAAELKARLQTFLADVDGKYEHDLPGWNEYYRIAGRTRASRSVFVELLNDPENRELLLAMGGPEGDLGNLVAARKQELYARRFQRTPGAKVREPAVAEVMALLLAETQVATRVVPRSISITVLLSSPGVREAIADPGENGKIYKSILLRWLDTRDDAASLYQGISIAMSLNLKEAAGVAARLATLKGATPYYRAQAILTLAKLEAKEHLPTLEKLLGDEQVLITINMANAERIQIQLGDAALASCLLLTGQDPESYGFLSRYKSSGSAMRYNYANWYMKAEQRKEALDRWKKWRVKHPDFEKGKQ